MKQSFFAGNRQAVSARLEGGILVASAYTQVQRSHDAAFAFEQEGNFWYLTGIEHPDWWVIIDAQRGKSWLVAPEVDETHALFDGQLAHDDARSVSGIADIVSRREALDLLQRTARTRKVVCTVGPPAHADQFDFTLNPAVRELKEVLDRTFASVRDARRDIAQLRARKQPEEIAMIEQAIRITSDAFSAVYASLGDCTHEYEVEAKFTYEIRRRGASGHAYDPIVAGGNNACTLHYGHNTQPLQSGTFLLLDVGARYGGYAADITRTYAIGEVSERHARIHDAVRQAHQAIVDLIEPGLRVIDYHTESDAIMQAALKEVGLMKEGDDTDVYRRYFPHAISHGLGIDVHDSLGGAEVFEPGMVLTVEPGIYIPLEHIGVRIEDDILVTEDGYRNLSEGLSTER